MSTEKQPGFFGRIFRKVDNEKPDQAPQTDIEQPVELTPTPIDEADAQLKDTEEVAETKEIAAEPEQPAEVEPQPEPDTAIISEHVSEPDAQPETTPEPTTSPPTGWFSRMRSGLSKTSTKISSGITGLFTKAKLDGDSIQDLEDILIQADLGVTTASKIADRIADNRFDKDLTPDDIRNILSEEVASALKPVAIPLEVTNTTKPHVIMMVGVNGSGKTTTIGKLASQFKAQGKSVMLVAGDTFRAAAVDQLDIWADRTDAKFMSRDIGADAAGLAFDAIQSAKSQGTDIIMIDTAGRLQNKATLMAELVKIIRVIKKLDETAPHSVILVLDATTGQNALSQVEVFQKEAGVTGLIMTKLDGTARGGILVAIAEKFALPIHAIGVGEQIDDLQPFDPDEFAQAIARTD